MPFLNRKGVTKVVVVLTIFGFYVFLTVILGLMGTSFIPSTNVDTPPGEPNLLSPLDFIVFFFAGLSFTIAGMPFGLNIIIFLPLGITMAYVIIDTIIPG